MAEVEKKEGADVVVDVAGSSVFNKIPKNLKKLDLSLPLATWEDCGCDATEFADSILKYGRGRGWEYFDLEDTRPKITKLAESVEAIPEALNKVKKEYEDACRPEKADISAEEKEDRRKAYLKARMRIRGMRTNLPQFVALRSGEELEEPPHVAAERALIWTLLEKALGSSNKLDYTYFLRNCVLGDVQEVMFKLDEDSLARQRATCANNELELERNSMFILRLLCVCVWCWCVGVRVRVVHVVWKRRMMPKHAQILPKNYHI